MFHFPLLLPATQEPAASAQPQAVDAACGSTVAEVDTGVHHAVELGLEQVGSRSVDTAAVDTAVGSTPAVVLPCEWENMKLEIFKVNRKYIRNAFYTRYLCPFG